MADTILQLNNVSTHFPIHSGFVRKRLVGTVKAVDGVTLAVRRGEVLGLVGESGCGKSTLARTIMQLVPTTGGTVVLNAATTIGVNSSASAPFINSANSTTNIVAFPNWPTLGCHIHRRC